MIKPEPIELENNLGPDAVTGEINRVPWMAYDVDEMDLYIAELESRIPVWNKCSEEMPQNYEDGETFLIAVEHESTMCPKRYYVTTAELVDGNWSDDEGRDIDEDFEYDLENSAFRSEVPQGTKKGFYRSKVTHWMPLPSAPKEGHK